MHLLEKDIIGQKISNLLQTRWENIEGVDACTVFVLLENASIIEVDYYEPEERSIRLTQLPDFPLIPAELNVEETCVGSRIKRVIWCDSWPSIGLLLNSGDVFTCRDRGAPFGIFGGFVYPKGSYENEELLDFWTRRKVLS